MVVAVQEDPSKFAFLVSDRGAAMNAALPANPHSGRTSDQSRARRIRSSIDSLAKIGIRSIRVSSLASRVAGQFFQVATMRIGNFVQIEELDSIGRRVVQPARKWVSSGISIPRSARPCGCRAG